MDKFKKDVHMFQKKLESFTDVRWCRMVRIRIHRNKKMKNIDYKHKKSWYWIKVFFVCLVIILGAYVYGTFLTLTNTQRKKYLKSQKMIILLK